MPSLHDDILSEILGRLPAKSVGRFRCVSKQWLSLTTDPQFMRTHSSISPISTSSFYISCCSLEPELFHVNGRNQSPLFDRSLCFIDTNGVSAKIVHSCNGLILCILDSRRTRGVSCFLLSVCNPTTKEHCVIPFPKDIHHNEFCLAFDPSVSPHFKIFTASYCDRTRTPYMNIFFSETWSWKRIYDDDDVLPMERVFGGVYWKGGILWSCGIFILRLDLATERFGRMLLPLQGANARGQICVGESKGNLHWIATSSDVSDGMRYMNSRVDIFEMESKSLEWSMLYRVDLDDIVDVYPEAKGKKILYLKVLMFLHGEEDGVGDRLLLSIHGKIVAYNLKDRTFSTTCGDLPTYGFYKYYWLQIYPHANTLFPLNAANVSTSHHDWLCWKSEHDKLLISLMVRHSLDGQKNKLSFRKAAWDDMVEKFNGATKLNYEARHLKYRLKSYKKEYNLVNTILSRAGFNWCPTRQIVIASDADWRKLFQKNYRSGEFLYKRKQVPFRELEIICAPSVTRCQEVSTSKITEREGKEKEFSQDTQQIIPLKRNRRTRE